MANTLNLKEEARYIGKPMQIGLDEDDKPVFATLGGLLTEALSVDGNTEQQLNKKIVVNVNGPEVFRRGSIATRMYEAMELGDGTFTPTQNELALIRKCIDARFKQFPGPYFVCLTALDVLKETDTKTKK